MAVEVARFAQVEASDAFIVSVVESALRAGKGHGDVSIAFIGEQRMRTLNRTYRGIDRPTDVLAFGRSDDEQERAGTFLGEIMICVGIATRQARRAGISLQEELTRLIVHGTLHLLDFDHDVPEREAKMFALQERVVGRVMKA
ncbi:MAG: rRNA maturation RNase YbeY [Candidatus Uhrbacteria bacterium]